MGCDKRAVGCHSTCSKYIEEHIKHEEEREQMRKIQVNGGFHAYSIPGVGDTKYRKKRKLQYYARGGRS